MDNNNIVDVIERTIDYAFEGRFMLNMYEYLKNEKVSRRDVQELLEGPTFASINILIYDLEDYLEGGSDKEHQQLREGYGYLGKATARKVKEYLETIIKDTCEYERDKKPGRRGKRTK